MTHEFFPDAIDREGSSNRSNIFVYKIVSALFLVTLGLLPLLFLPHIFVLPAHGKAMILLSVMILTIVARVFYLFKKQTHTFRINFGILSLVGIGLSSLVTVLFVSDPLNSIFDATFSIHSTAATVIAVTAGVVASILFKKDKNITLFLVLLLASLAAVLLLATITIIFLHSSLVSLTLTAVITAGGWNNLALLTSLFILLTSAALVTVVHRVWQAIALAAFGFCALFVLLAINIPLLWVMLLLGALSIVFYEYKTSRHTLIAGKIFLYSTLVLSALMTFFGRIITAWLPDAMQISYMEVYPSWSSTLSIGEQMLKTAPIVGVGPTYFSTAWQQWKDISVYQTNFWESDFFNASSHISTAVIEQGLLGLVTWVLFFGALIYSTVRIYRRRPSDSTARFLVLGSVVATWYLCVALLVLNVSFTIVVFTFVFAGLFFMLDATQAEQKTSRLIFVKAGFKKQAFNMAALGLTLFFIAGVFYAGSNFVAFAQANKAVNTITDPALLEKALVDSYNTFPHGELAYTLAKFEYTRMRSVLVAEPTTEDVAVFRESATKALSAIDIAITHNAKNVHYQQTKASILITLLQAGFTDEYIGMAKDVLAEAESLSPQHPTTSMLKAEYALTQKDVAGAKQILDELVKIRPHIPAYDLAIQISLASDNKDEAFTVLNNTIGQFSNNPRVLFGVSRVLLSLEAVEDAELVLQQVLVLDPQYADAKYTLATIKAIQGQTEQALSLLAELQETNPDNQLLAETVQAVEAGEYNVAEQASSTEIVLESGEEEEEKIPDGEIVSTPNTVVDDVVSEDQ